MAPDLAGDAICGATYDTVAGLDHLVGRLVGTVGDVTCGTLREPATDGITELVCAVPCCAELHYAGLSPVCV